MPHSSGKVGTRDSREEGTENHDGGKMKFTIEPGLWSKV